MRSQETKGTQMSYRKSASVYDAIYTQMKDYRLEASRVHRLVLDVIGRVNTRDLSLLDVACGTGLHLQYFQSWFEHAEGLDLDNAMLKTAHKRVPLVRLHQTSMTNFNLGRQFDVVTCLFSAIGHLVDREDLEAAIIHMARHLNPGGVLVIEPWLKPEAFDPERSLGAEFVDQGKLKVSRITRIKREGRITRLEMHYTIGTPEGVEYFQEVHKVAMWSEDDFRRAFNRAGLEVNFDPAGLSNNGRGIYVAVKPK